MKKKAFKHMTQESFDKVKLLLGAKLKVRQIAQITGVSTGTVCTVGKSATLDEYKKYITEKNLARKVNRLGQATQSEVKESETVKTPLYDVLVEIRDLIADTNRLIALSGKSKGFKLF